MTERDWQKADPTNLRAKNSDTFKPMGPWIVTGIDPACHDHECAAQRQDLA